MTEEIQKLRRWSAELMGWDRKGDNEIGYGYYWEEKNPDGVLIGFVDENDWTPDKPETGQIWMVVERMRKLGWLMIEFEQHPTYYEVGFAKDTGGGDTTKLYEAKDTEPCHAILKAAHAAWSRRGEG